jgi:hypothetical protein
MQQPQIEEWLEGETTRWFLRVLKERLDATFMRRAEVYYPGEPHRTQEGKAFLLGQEDVLSELIEAFESKQVSELEELDEEHVGNPSLRRPGSHKTR